MDLLDVNVLVYAHRRDTPRHERYRAWLEDLAGATGRLVPDAALAALAIEHGCTVLTADRDFARFDGLKWRDPVPGGKA